MILALDIGNSQIHGGLFDGVRLLNEFRKSTTSQATEDEIGIFLVQVLREWSRDPGMLHAAGVASVVPALLPAMVRGIRQYLGCEPVVLQPGTRTGLRIQTKAPEEVGADRIASSIGAFDAYPNENLIVIDMGTATTFDCLTADKTFHGGVIAPGLRLSMEALFRNTAKLPPVEIRACEHALGRSTETNIQSGLYFGHIGLIRELLPRLKAEAFGPDAECRVIATGGSAEMFMPEGLFDSFEPHLVLKGIRIATEMNLQTNRKGKGKGRHETHLA